MIRRIGVLFCLGILVLVLPGCGEGEDGGASSSDVTGGGDTVTPVEAFSVSSAHQTAPEDVLREIAFYATGGGGGMCDVAGICDQSYQAPTVVAFSEHVGLGEPMGIAACGWQPDEGVHVTVRLPGGEEFAQDVQAVEELGTYYACFEYSAALDDPAGSYTFILEGESGTVQRSVRVTEPSAPRLQRDGDRLLLCAFEPDERVRLLAYERAGYEPGVLLGEVGVLAGWREYRVDSSGRLAIQVEGDYAYAIVGDVSGEALPYGARGFRDVLSFSVEADTGSEPLDVREGPGRDQRVVSQVTSGTRMRVNAQPRQFAEDTWLPVRLGDGTAGWVLEGDVKVVTEPSPATAQPPTSTPRQGSGQAPAQDSGQAPASATESPPGCPGAPPQRVRAGDRAQVCTTHDRLVMRERPGRGGTEVARLEPGTYIRVVGGPACEDGCSWWQVRADSGTAGWVAEGGDEVDPYYICPAR